MNYSHTLLSVSNFTLLVITTVLQVLVLGSREISDNDDIDESFMSTFSSISLVDSECRRQSIWEDESMQRNQRREALNNALETISDGRYSPIKSTLSTDWEDLSEKQRKYYVRKAEEVLDATLTTIAPGQEDILREAIQNKMSSSASISSSTQTLITAYNSADSWEVKRQILSLLADQYSKEDLQHLIPGLSVWRIDQARRHKSDYGPGQPVPPKTIIRTRLDPVMTDHFLEFISSPSVLQDVAFGTKTLTLSTGEKLTIPAAIRTVIPSRIVHMYKQHCLNSGVQHASDSTLYRILDACSASLQKSLKGLDNFTAEGSEAFDTMQHIIDVLGDHGVAEDEWLMSASRRLKDGKNYLKIDFKTHLALGDWCADHCITYSLSDPKNDKFKSDCEHEHDLACDRCEDLCDVLSEIEAEIHKAGSSVTSEELARLQFEYKNAVKSITDWKSHILRTINQDQAKQDVLNSLDQENCFVIMDWAMKFLPMVFREKMSDFFGKRGKSWHVSAIITRSPAKDFDVECLVHLFETCKQDCFAVAGILEDVLKTVKKENPKIRRAYLKSDNAGCYHNAQLLLTIDDISKTSGIDIVRYDFSDPQAGKDVCDRKLAHMKAHIRRYVNEHNDVTTASEMKKALESHGGTKGCRYAVAEMDNSDAKTDVKLDGISYLYNFSFTADGFRAWKAFNVGDGEYFKYKSFGSGLPEVRSLQIVEAFGPAEMHSHGVFKTSSEVSSDKSKMFHCPDSACVLSFPTLAEQESHMHFGEHVRILERETVFDKVKKKWAQNVANVAKSSRPISAKLQTSSTCSVGKSSSVMGWALKKKASASRISPAVKEWLKCKFDSGETSGKKADAAKVAREMQHKRDETGRLKFPPEEWLTSKQITGFFSRLASGRKSSTTTQDQDQEYNIDDDGNWNVLEEANREMREAVYSALDLSHPIMYNHYNICQLVKTTKITKLKLAELRAICSGLEISITGASNRKASYISQLEELTHSCGCT